MFAKLRAVSHRDDRATVADPLHSATYRDLDADADLLIERTTAAIAAQSLVDIVEADLDTLVLPERSAAAAAAVPTPPISAVLTTAIYLHYVGQAATARNVVWTLHHYWTGQQSDSLHLTGWQQAMARIGIDEPDTHDGLVYLHTWISAVVESAQGFIA